MSKINRIHLYYIIGVLGGLLVWQITLKASGDTALVNAISFASTISSIILAILAIILTIASSSSIANVLMALSQSAERIEVGAASVERAASDLNVSVAEVPSRLEEISNKLDRSQESWGSTNADLKAAISQALEDSGKSKQSQSGLAELLSDMSPAGALSVYTALKAHSKGVEYDTRKFLGSESAAFSRGFIQGLSMRGDIDVGSINKVIHVNSVRDLQLDVVESFLERMSKSNKFIEINKPKVDKYFSEDNDLA